MSENEEVAEQNHGPEKSVKVGDTITVYSDREDKSTYTCHTVVAIDPLRLFYLEAGELKPVWHSWRNDRYHGWIHPNALSTGRVSEVTPPMLIRAMRAASQRNPDISIYTVQEILHAALNP